MRSGALNRLLDIEHRVQTGIEQNNEPRWEWRKYRDQIFCSAQARRGVEQFDAGTGQRFAESITRFRIHYLEAEGIDPTMKIVFEGQRYDIRVILPDHERQEDCWIDAALQDGNVVGAGISLFAEPVLVGEVGEAYQTVITVTGGTAPLEFTVDDGSSPSGGLPAGLAIVQISDNQWSLEGYPEVAGAFPIAIAVEDGAGQTASLPAFTLTISP